MKLGKVVQYNLVLRQKIKSVKVGCLRLSACWNIYRGFGVDTRKNGRKVFVFLGRLAIAIDTKAK